MPRFSPKNRINCEMNKSAHFLGLKFALLLFISIHKSCARYGVKPNWSTSLTSAILSSMGVLLSKKFFLSQVYVTLINAALILQLEHIWYTLWLLSRLTVISYLIWKTAYTRVLLKFKYSNLMVDSTAI